MLQEVFLRVLEKRHSFRGDASPGTWIYQLTTRHCINQLRQRDRRRELMGEQGDPWWSPAVSSPDQEPSALVAQLWRTLEPEIVTAGVYFHLDGMSRQEIADLQGCSLRTVGNRLNALRKAARALAEEGT